MTEYTFRMPKTSEFELKYYYEQSDDVVEEQILPAHIHDKPEIYILTRGAACFAVENRIYRLTAGDMIIARPNEMHHCILTERGPHNHLCFWFDPTFDFLEPLLQSCNVNGNHISPSEKSKEKLLLLYDTLMDASVTNNQRKIYATLCQILCEAEDGIGQSSPAPSALPPLLNDILQDIEKNFKTIEGINYFTEMYFISASTLGRLFRTYLHTSPRIYLETKKLAYARVLLRNGASVTEGAVQAGFSDISGFIRLFRKRYGMTPGEYKSKGTQKAEYRPTGDIAPRDK